MFLEHGLLLGSIGVVAGVIFAIGLTRLMTSLLFGVSPVDAATYVVGATVLLISAALASLLPVHGALAANPVATLKSE